MVKTVAKNMYSKLFVLYFCVFITYLIIDVTAEDGSHNDVRKRLSPGDPSSFARPDFAVVRHMELKLKVDFARKIFFGEVLLTIEKINSIANEIILDAKDLQIKFITDTLTGAFLNYTLGKPYGNIGSKLTIELPKMSQRGKEFVIRIVYNTSPEASGLLWLKPEQTVGKTYPFVFSNFQPIGARSFLPCQDTPSVKATYFAEISCPRHLNTIMSARHLQTIDTGSYKTYFFLQRVKVQSYLIALAIGNLQSKRIGPRSSVYSEPGNIQAAVHVLIETEGQLQTAEKLCGPYVWGNYDFLILPPSYPFGGMENPSLTFLTPRILTAGRSKKDLVLHEMAHSWTGNSITNANFEHFWLNEGFTTFLERRLVGKIDGKRAEDFAAYCGLSRLRENVRDLGPHNNLTKLVPDLSGVHPDDGITTIPYEKGYIFLRYLETVVGGPHIFEPFLRNYIKQFKNMCIVSNDFKYFFKWYFGKNEAIKTINWNTWFYQTGMPHIIPKYDKTIINKVKNVTAYFLKWANSSSRTRFPIKEYAMSAKEKIQLLHEILESKPIRIGKLEEFDKEWKLFDVKDSEMLLRWLRICIKSRWNKAVYPAFDLLGTHGSLSVQTTLFKDLYDWQEVRKLAIKYFKRIEKGLMTIVVKAVEKVLHLK